MQLLLVYLYDSLRRLFLLLLLFLIKIITNTFCSNPNKDYKKVQVIQRVYSVTITTKSQKQQQQQQQQQKTHRSVWQRKQSKTFLGWGWDHGPLQPQQQHRLWLRQWPLGSDITVASPINSKLTFGLGGPSAGEVFRHGLFWYFLVVKIRMQSYNQQHFSLFLQIL